MWTSRGRSGKRQRFNCDISLCQRYHCHYKGLCIRGRTQVTYHKVDSKSMHHGASRGCFFCGSVAVKYLPCGHQLCVSDLTSRAKLVISDREPLVFQCPVGVCGLKLDFPDGGYEVLPNTPLGSALLAKGLPSPRVLDDRLPVQLSYVSSADVLHYLLCPICTDPFVDPVTLPCSEHTFCRSCIMRCASPNCPSCRTPFAPQQVLPVNERLLLRMLGDLKVHCPRRNEGCDWSGPRSNVAEHVRKSCDSHQCPFKLHGCQWRGRNLLVAAHELQCDFNLASCLAVDLMCDWKGPRHQLASHTRDCAYQKLRPLLVSLMHRVDVLEDQVKSLLAPRPTPP